MLKSLYSFKENEGLLNIDVEDFQETFIYVIFAIGNLQRKTSIEVYSTANFFESLPL